MYEIKERLLDFIDAVPKPIKLVLGAISIVLLIGVCIGVYSTVSTKDEREAVQELEAYQEKFLKGEELAEEQRKTMQELGDANVIEYTRVAKLRYANSLTLEEKQDDYLKTHVVDVDFKEPEDGIYVIYTREDNTSKNVLEALKEGSYDVGTKDVYVIIKDVQSMYQTYVSLAMENEDIQELGLEKLPMVVYIKDGSVEDYLESNDIDRFNTWVKMLGG